MACLAAEHSTTQASELSNAPQAEDRFFNLFFGDKSKEDDKDDKYRRPYPIPYGYQRPIRLPNIKVTLNLPKKPKSPKKNSLLNKLPIKKPLVLPVGARLLGNAVQKPIETPVVKPDYSQILSALGYL